MSSAIDCILGGHTKARRQRSNNSLKPSPLRGLGAGAMIEPSPRPQIGPGLAQALGGMKQLLRLRIVVTEPVPGVHFALQRGKSELVAPTSREPELIFDFTVHAELLNDPLRLTGEFTQGPPAARFIYINSGSYAGQPGTIWSRRAKVPISGIKAQMATDAIASNCVLQAVVCGVAKDGGPFCASIPLLKDWMVVSAS